MTTENTELTDDDPMPFGKYGPPPKGQGKKMKDVPASYLLWLYDEGTKHKGVHGYIEANLDCLQQECPGWIPPDERDETSEAYS